MPDFREGDETDPYLTTGEDLAAAEQLHARARSGGFREALAAYYATNSRVPAAQADRFIASTLAAEERAAAVLSQWSAWCGTGIAGPVIDIGCGTGPLLAAAPPGAALVGVDIGLRWLVLASARLRERGVAAAFACASARRLPLADATVALAASESLIENVPDASAAMAEMARIVRPGGWIGVTTANRWSLGPDPHVGLPLGGWLPDRVVAAWSARRGMVPPRRRLLGLSDLRRLFRGAGLELERVGVPTMTARQRDAASVPLRLAVDLYRMVSRSAAGRRALLAVGPSLVAVARRR